MPRLTHLLSLALSAALLLALPLAGPALAQTGQAASAAPLAAADIEAFARGLAAETAHLEALADATKVLAERPDCAAIRGALTPHAEAEVAAGNKIRRL